MSRRCQVIDCGAAAVAVVRQTLHCASPGAEHDACEEHAVDAHERDLIVTSIVDGAPWTPPHWLEPVAERLKPGILRDFLLAGTETEKRELARRRS